MLVRMVKAWAEKGKYEFLVMNAFRFGTGLTDSQGCHIYEGDLIQAEYINLTTDETKSFGMIGGVVVLRNGQFQICGNPRNTEETGTFLGSPLITKLTVLGEQDQEQYLTNDDEDETITAMKAIWAKMEQGE